MIYERGVADYYNFVDYFIFSFPHFCWRYLMFSLGNEVAPSYKNIPPDNWHNSIKSYEPKLPSTIQR